RLNFVPIELRTHISQLDASHEYVDFKYGMTCLAYISRVFCSSGLELPMCTFLKPSRMYLSIAFMWSSGVVPITVAFAICLSPTRLAYDSMTRGSEMGYWKTAGKSVPAQHRIDSIAFS